MDTRDFDDFATDRNDSASPLLPRSPAADDVQRVETERVGDSPRPEYRFGSAEHQEFNLGGAHFSFARFSSDGLQNLKPPLLATWICLALAWIFLGSKVPFTVFLGIPFNLAALILAASCLSRGGVKTGMLVMGLGTVGSLLVYLIGVFRFFVLWV